MSASPNRKPRSNGRSKGQTRVRPMYLAMHEFFGNQVTLLMRLDKFADAQGMQFQLSGVVMPNGQGIPDMVRLACPQPDGTAVLHNLAVEDIVSVVQPLPKNVWARLMGQAADHESMRLKELQESLREAEAADSAEESKIIH